MISGPGSSFIPKQDRVSVPASMRRRRTFSVLHFIASVALLASILLAAGTYFYKHQQLSKQEELKAQLQTMRDALAEADVFSVQNFNRKLQAANFLINNHTAPSKIFTALEEKTLQRVQFGSFKYKYTPGEEAILTLNGSTLEFSTLALQGRSFAENELIEMVIAKSVASAAEGSTDNSDVIFSFEGPVDMPKLQYDGSSAGQATAPVAAQPTASAPDTLGQPVSGTTDFIQTGSSQGEVSNVSN